MLLCALNLVFVVASTFVRPKSEWLFWISFFVTESTVLALGLDVILDRRVHKRMREDFAQVDFWQNEFDKHARQLALDILNGKLGIGVLGNSEEEVNEMGAVLHARIEGMRTALNRHNRESAAVKLAWERDRLIPKGTDNR